MTNKPTPDEDWLLASIMENAIQVQIPRDTKDYTGVTVEVNVLELVAAINTKITELLENAQTRIDINTWLYLAAYTNKCLCEACLEIHKQKQRIARLTAEASEGDVA